MDSPRCQLYQHLLGVTRIHISSGLLCTATLVFLKLCWTSSVLHLLIQARSKNNRQLCFDDSRGGGSAKDPRAADPPASSSPAVTLTALNRGEHK